MSAAPYRWRLMAERTDGTARMIFDLSNDRASLEAKAERLSTPRTRYWVESHLDAEQESSLVMNTDRPGSPEPS